MSVWKPYPPQPWKWSKMLWENGFHTFSGVHILVKSLSNSTEAVLLAYGYFSVFPQLYTFPNLLRFFSISENSPGNHLSIILFWDSEIREKPSFFFPFFMTMFLKLTLKLKSSQSGNHPRPGVLSLVWCPACCGNCDTFFALKKQVRIGNYLYKRVPPTHWQSTDDKVAFWNLGPNDQTTVAVTFLLLFLLVLDIYYIVSTFSKKSISFCINMAFLISLILLSSWTPLAFTFPRNTFVNTVKGSRVEFESSGSGPDEPFPGIVKVVQLDRHSLAQPGLFRKGLTQRRAPSLGSRLSFPAFLSQGRPGLAPASKASASPLHHLQPQSSTEIDLKKRQGLQMWQRAIHKGDKTMSLPVSLKDTKQTCTAVSFTQVRSKDFLCHDLPNPIRTRKNKIHKQVP